MTSLTRVLAASVAVCLFGMGCGEDSEILSEGEYLFFEQVGIGQSGVPTDTLEWVVSSPEEWADVSQQLEPHVPFEAVDFSQSVVVVVGIPTESGGYHVEIESVEEMEDEVVVSYLFHRPALDCITLSAQALPFRAVSVRRFEGKPVKFDRRVQKYECTWKQ